MSNSFTMINTVCKASYFVVLKTCLLMVLAIQSTLANAPSRTLKPPMIQCPAVDYASKESVAQWSKCMQINTKMSKQWMRSFDEQSCDRSLGDMARNFHGVLEESKQSDNSDELYSIVKQTVLKTGCYVGVKPVANSPATLFHQSVVADYESGLSEGQTVKNAVKMCQKWQEISPRLLSHNWCDALNSKQYNK